MLNTDKKYTQYVRLCDADLEQFFRKPFPLAEVKRELLKLDTEGKSRTRFTQNAVNAFIAKLLDNPEYMRRYRVNV